MEYRVCTLDDLEDVVALNEMRNHAFNQPMSDYYKSQYRQWMQMYFLPTEIKTSRCFGAFDGNTLAATMCTNTRRVYPKFRWDHWRSNRNYPISTKKNAIVMNTLMSFMFRTMLRTENCTSAYTLYPAGIYEKYKRIKTDIVGSENVCYDFELLERIEVGMELSTRVKHSFNIRTSFESEMLFLEAKVKNIFLDRWKSINIQ